MRAGRVRRTLLVGVVAAMVLAEPAGVAWAAPSPPGAPGQVATARAATPPTADPQPPRGRGSNPDPAAAARQAAEAAAQQAGAAAEQQAEAAAVAQAVAAAQQQAGTAGAESALTAQPPAAVTAQQQAAVIARQQAAAAARQQAAAVQAQARAAKLAAQQSVAAQRANTVWDRRGRPKKLVVVRTTSIVSIAAGVEVQRAVRNGRTVSLATLRDAIPASWLTIDGNTAQLNAAVVLTPDTLLDVQGVKTLQLAGGFAAADAADLYTGSGRIQLRGVTVTSIDPGSGRAVAPDAAGRPYIVVAALGKLDATDTTISDLGTRPSGVDRGKPAVVYGRGSTGSLTRVSLLRNSTGLVLAGSQGVRLQDVTTANSTEDGLVLRGDVATVLAGIKAEGNGADGVLVYGDVTSRPITGISTDGNQSYGVSVVGQHNVDIGNLTLSGDQAGGLELVRDNDSKVHDITSTDEPIGVFLHQNCANVLIDAVTLTGGRTGILEEKTTKGLHVTGSTIGGSQVAGMEIGGRDTVLDGLTVKDSRAALRVERGAVGVTADRVSFSGGTDGLVTSGGTSGVVVKDLSADGVGNDAVRSLSPGMQVVGGRISGGDTGMDLEAATTVTGIQIGLATTGIRARAGHPVMLDAVRVDAVTAGVDAEPGSVVTLRNSSAHALAGVRGTVTLLGTNDLSLPSLNFLGAIGLPLIVLAVVLESLHLLRQRGIGSSRRTRPPVLAMGAG